MTVAVRNVKRKQKVISRIFKQDFLSAFLYQELSTKVKKLCIIVAFIR